jgi:leucyl aminopeptidase
MQTLLKLFISLGLLFVTPILFAAQYEIKYPMQIKKIFNQIQPEIMWNQLRLLTKFPDRSVFHKSGIEAAQWITQQAESLASNHADVQVYTVKTKGTDIVGTEFDYQQPSIILKIGTSNEPAIVIGAHFDTVACSDESCMKDGPFPGADDNGSGTVALLEAARAILSSNYHFKKPIYFIWYAGEEVGQLGSQAVVNEFRKNQILVDAVLQLDMIGWEYKNDPTMWLHSDKWNDTGLNQFAEKLITFYINRPVKYTSYGIGGSNDFIWSYSGYKAIGPRESEDDKLHSKSFLA